MFLIVILLIVFCYLIYYYLTYNYNYWKDRNVCGPKPIPMVGNVPSILTRRRHIIYEINELYHKFRDESFIGIFLMRSPYVLVINGEMVKEVMIKNFDSFHDNQFSEMIDPVKDPLLANNPFTLCGNEWRDKRREITPAFTSSRIKSMFPIIENLSKRMTRYINEEISKSSSINFSCDAKELAAKYTTDVVANCIFNLDANSFMAERAYIRDMGRHLMKTSLRNIFYYLIRAIFPFVKYFWKISFVPEECQNFFTGLMMDTVRYRTKNDDVKRVDFVDYLLYLRARKGITEVEMAAYGVTFFIDGFETTSVLMAHVLYQLGRNRIAQQKLYKEIVDRLNHTDDGIVTYEIINEMQYLDQVIHETLRLFPPLLAIAKKCTASTKLETKDGRPVSIDKDVNVLIPIYSIQRNPEYYVEPDKFIPERFDPETGGIKSYREKGVYLPFGEGPRICLGMRFAMAQTKMGLIEIMRHFEISISKKTKQPLIMDPNSMNATPLGGIWLDLKPRGSFSFHSNV